MILLLLLLLLYGPWPVATIRRPNARLRQWIFASTLAYARGCQQVDRDRLVGRRSSAGRSRLILHWIDKITKKNTCNEYQYSRKYIHFSINWLVPYILWCLLWWLTTGQLGRCREVLYNVFLSFRDNHDLEARDNLLFICAPLTKAMVHCICTCNTQIWNFVLVTLLPTGRSRVSKKFSSRS